MDFERLEKILKNWPKFRLVQAQKAVFQDLIDDWSEVTVLPLSLKQKLTESCSLQIEAKTFVADQGKTVKALITLSDGLKVETVLMRYGERHTVCVSSMVGCPLSCAFCATGQMGFKRNLGHWEIIEQVLFFKRYLKSACPVASDSESCGVVFMGMGEPFLNYDNVLAAVRILNDPNAFGIGARHISLSTVGVIPGIEKLAREPLQVNLAFSLHAADPKQRNRLMPVNRAYPLEAVLAALSRYAAKTRRKVMFEYIMIKGVNDSENQAWDLIKLLSSFPRRLCLVNLIQYNPTGLFVASPRETIRVFRRVLEKEGIEVTERLRLGRGIKAACGQLMAANEK